MQLRTKVAFTSTSFAPSYPSSRRLHNPISTVMGKRIGPPRSPVLIEPDLDLRTKNRDPSPQNSAAMTLLALRSDSPLLEKEVSSVKPLQKRKRSVSFTVDDEEEARFLPCGVNHAVNLKKPRATRLVPGPSPPPPISKALQRPGVVLHCGIRMKNHVWLPVGRPLRAPPRLGPPPRHLAKELKPLKQFL